MLGSFASLSSLHSSSSENPGGLSNRTAAPDFLPPVNPMEGRDKSPLPCAPGLAKALPLLPFPGGPLRVVAVVAQALVRVVALVPHALVVPTLDGLSTLASSGRRLPLHGSIPPNSLNAAKAGSHFGDGTTGATEIPSLFLSAIAFAFARAVFRLLSANRSSRVCRNGLGSAIMPSARSAASVVIAFS